MKKYLLTHKSIKFIIACILFVGVSSGTVFIAYKALESNILTLIASLGSESNPKKMITGVINIEKVIDEFDSNAKELSLDEEIEGYTESNGMQQTAAGNSVQQSVSGSSVSSLQKPLQSINYASLSGINAQILEGDIFDPLKDLKLKAMDRDGSDITHKIQVDASQVNVYEGGHYAVIAKVFLSDGSTIAQSFNVEVISKPLDVQVSNISFDKNEANQTETINLMLDIYSSKPSIIPTTININGTEYPISQTIGNRYSVQLKTSNEAKKECYNVNSIQMSDGTVISVDQKVYIDVLKNNPQINSFAYDIDSRTGRLAVKFEILDKDATLHPFRPLSVVLYDENDNQLDIKYIYSDNTFDLYYNIPKNGDYYLKVFAEFRLSDIDQYVATELLSEKLIIDSIDKTTLEGEDVTIKEGESFNPIKDLNLKAIDKDGSDITSSILIEESVDTTVPGIYEVKVKLVNSDKKEIEKVFNVTVQPVETVLKNINFESLQKQIVQGDSLIFNLNLMLSKDYINVEKVIINNEEYPVIKQNQESYQIEISSLSLSGVCEFHLSELILSNDEKIIIDEKTIVEILTITPYTVSISHEEDLKSGINIVSEVEARKVEEEDAITSISTRTIAKSGVATTTINDTILGKDTQSLRSDLIISGHVQTGDGTAPEGQTSVSLPTSVSFIVDQNGDVIPPTGMKITNHSSVGIDITVASFTDSTTQEGAGITLVSVGDLKDKDRSFVSLSLSASGSANSSTIELLSTGVQKTKLTSIDANGMVGLTLVGQAGTMPMQSIDTQGVKDTFTLVFEIKKQ